MNRVITVLLLTLGFLNFDSAVSAQTVSTNTVLKSQRRDSEPRLILAHFMPWFESNESQGTFGWHWTMNSADPTRVTANGKREIAAHYYPTIGAYHSGDEAVLEQQLLTMKLAGIDGVIVDWYGLGDLHDYALLHKNTQQLIRQVRRFNMKFAICYEDQTIAAYESAGRLKSSDRVAHAVKELKWLHKNWFQREDYVQLDGKPLLLSFGFDGLTDDQWEQTLKQIDFDVAYFSEHRRRSRAVGAFDWPVPKQSSAALDRFYQSAQKWPEFIPVAYPRFHDYYQQAGVYDSWGRIDDQAGKTFKTTLERALQSKARVVQIATWNDWSEGTMIEPSVEFGKRDLELIQKLRRKHIDDSFPHQPQDLVLPDRLLDLRRSKSAKELQEQIAQLLSDGKTADARARLKSVKRD